MILDSISIKPRSSRDEKRMEIWNKIPGGSHQKWRFLLDLYAEDIKEKPCQKTDRQKISEIYRLFMERFANKPPNWVVYPKRAIIDIILEEERALEN